MSRIRLLSDHIANQIAAGEVVERPASVVKELLENSLDAGADRIEISVENAGTRLIRVVDNGMGMDEDDVLLCLERHATSKLRCEEELEAIGTLGFRGEAIPSIASVSRMILISRSGEEQTGTRAEIHYGTLRSVRAHGCARGTIVEVRSLFGNVPARKKFLKTPRTEQFHIEDTIRDQALAHPGIHFMYRCDRGRGFEYASVSSLEARLRQVFRLGGDLLSIDRQEDQEVPMRVRGALLLPESARVPALRLRLFVNHRPVRDRMLAHAVAEAMRGFLLKGTQPAGCLFLELPPDQVDVNVHPAKREIRFRNGQAVHTLVSGAVRQALQEHQQRLRSRLFSPRQDEAADAGRESVPASREGMARKPGAKTGETEAPFSGREITDPPSGIPDAATVAPASREPSAASRQAVSAKARPCGAVKEQQAGDMGRIRLIGQLFDLYLLCEHADGLLIVDQHAAHERILYGRLLSDYMNQAVASQALLFPVTVELSPQQAETASARPGELSRLGFDASEFGDLTWMIRAVPALAARVPAEELLRETLDAMRAGRQSGEGGIAPSIGALFASMACKAAVRGGDRMHPEEMIALLLQMEKSEVFSHCPHGRPVLKIVSRREVEQWFQRS